MSNIRNILGPPAGGSDFFDRKEELERLRRAVEDGNHVLISSPRRVGKSSLAGQLCAVLREAHWQATLVDVQDALDELQFVERIIERLQDAGLKIPWFDHVAAWVQRLRRLVG